MEHGPSVLLGLLALVALLGLVVLLVAGAAASLPAKAASPGPRKPLRVQVVVARYAEDVSWLRQLPFRDIVVYDKFDNPRRKVLRKFLKRVRAGELSGEDLDNLEDLREELDELDALAARDDDERTGPPPPYAKVVKLPNVGRCDHTYLYHIVTNWDNLADVTIFVPGSCASAQSKWNKLQWIVSQVGRTGDSAFPVDHVTVRPLDEQLGAFKLDSYVASEAANAAMNPESSLQLSRHRPFGVFFRAMFPDTPAVHEVAYQGVFAVSRQHIRQHPRARYERLLSCLDSHSNPEAGHYMERSWLAAFHPVPAGCKSLAHVPKTAAGAFTPLLVLAAAAAVAMLVVRAQ